MASAAQTNGLIGAPGVVQRYPTPFRAASKSAPPRRRTIVTKAANDGADGPDGVQKALAAFAAATIAFAPVSDAVATESGIMPSRNRAEDNAARAFMDANEKKGPALQQRSADPNSGNVETFNIAGGAQPDRRVPAPRTPKADPNNPVPLQDQIRGLPATQGSSSPAAREAADKLEPGSVIEQASASQRGVSFDTLSAPQVNVSKRVGNAVQGAAKDTAQNVKKAFTDPTPKNNAKNQANALKRAGELANPKNVSYGSSGGLQKNVGLFGLGTKAKGAAQDAANKVKSAAPGNDLGNQAQDAAKGITEDFRSTAKKAISSPDPAGNAKNQANALKRAGEMANPKNVSYGGSRGLQKNVGLFGLGDKAKGAAQDAANKAKSAAPGNDLGNQAQDAAKGITEDFRSTAKKAISSPDPAGNAKNQANALKRAGEMANPKNVSYSPSRGLQVDAGLFGLGDKAKGAAQDAANKAQSAAPGNDLGNQAQDAAKGITEDFRSTAKKAISSPDPAGNAKNQANALKRAGEMANPKNVSFDTYDAESLQVNAGLFGLGDKAKSAASDAANKAKSAAPGNDLGSQAQDAAKGITEDFRSTAKKAVSSPDPAGNAKNQANALKRAGQMANPKNVGFWGNGSDLQVNVESRGIVGNQIRQETGASGNSRSDRTAPTPAGTPGAAGNAKKDIRRNSSGPAAGFDAMQVNVRDNVDRVVDGSAKEAGKIVRNAGNNAKKVVQSKTAAPVFDSSIQVNVSEKVGRAVDSAAKDAGNAAKDAAGAAKKAVQKNTAAPAAFDRDAVQVNVVGTGNVFGRGAVGTVRDQVDEVKDVAKQAADNPVSFGKNRAEGVQRAANENIVNPAGPDQSRDAAQQLQDANAEVPRALSSAAKKAKDAITSPASFPLYDVNSLQKNVVGTGNVFGRGAVGTVKDQVDEVKDVAKQAVDNPASFGKNRAEGVQRAANENIVNPAGPDQSRDAAQQLQDANAEVPRALSSGAKKIKDAVTPTAFQGFDAATLQRNAGLQWNVGLDAAAENTAQGAKAVTKGAESLAKSDMRLAQREAENSAGQKGGPDPADKSMRVVDKASGGAQSAIDKAKNAVQSGASWAPSDPASLQTNVRVGDLQSITGGQAKKAGIGAASTASDTAKSDGQLVTDRSTSGVKARGSGGAAPRAEKRVEKLAGN